MEILKRRVLTAAVALAFAIALPAAAQDELDQEIAGSLANAFKEVAARSAECTVCISLEVGGKTGFGSGAIISRDGLVLTCAHVAEAGENLKATTSDGVIRAVRKLGMNSTNDYALLKMEGGPFPCFSLGASSDLKIGDWVMALGHPGGPYEDMKPAFSVGRVTGLHKKLPVQLQKKFYDDAIKTNVPIFAGNSGGPLVDIAGRLVGINGAILLINENAYAVPIDEIARDVKKLASGQDVEGRKSGNYREIIGDLQKEIDPRDLEKMYGKTALGKMLGMFMKSFGGGKGDEKTDRPPTRGEFLSGYFRKLNSEVSGSVVEILSGGETAGYGVIVDSKGFVLTNLRVAEARDLSVKIAGAGTFRAEVAGRHGGLDVAMLKVEAGRPLPAARLGSAADLKPGDWVITASPGEVPQAVGVVSVVRRKIGGERKIPTMGLFGMFGTPNESPLRPYDRVLHHDSRIAKGMFGSPVFGADGSLVGINVANFYPGSSFAAAAEDIAAVAEELKNGMSVKPPAAYGEDVQGSQFGGGADMFKDFFGNIMEMFKNGELDLDKLMKGELDLEKLFEKLFRPKDPSKPPAKDPAEEGSPYFGVQIDQEETERVVVSEVVESSSAEKAGLKAGDVILDIGGKEVKSFDDLRGAVTSMKPGDKFKVTILRGGARMVLDAVMGKR